jgi:hypothetical protein
MAAVEVTAADIITRFPTFTGQDAVLTALIDEWKGSINPAWSDADYKTALMYLVAHFAIAEDNADAFPTTSESLGPISVSYQVPSDALVNSLRNTEYGRRYLMIANRAGAGSGIIVVVPSGC